MSVFTVSTAGQLSAALASAQAGDTIQLNAGNYGDVSISGKSFASDVTITSANTATPAVLNSLSISGSTHIAITGLQVAHTPTATTYAWSPVVSVSNSSYVTFSNSTVTGGAAVNGVAATATALDSTGNVIGYPTGYGVSVSGSHNVTVQGVSISDVGKGLVLNKSSAVDFDSNTISNIRTSAIDGADLNNITINNNDISGSHPWRWGQTPVGDHGDFIHIWTDAGVMTSASAGITITNNYIHQGDGVAILGINLEDNSGLGFVNAKVQDNIIINANFQAVRLENSSQAVVSGNTLLQPGGAYNDAPSILFRSGGGNNTITNNITGGVNMVSGVVDETGATSASTITGNTVVQTQATTTAGYYSAAIIAGLTGTASTIASQLQSLGLLSAWGGTSGTSGTGTGTGTGTGSGTGSAGAAGSTASTYSNTAVNISTNLNSLNGNSTVTKIVVSDNAAVAMTAAQWTGDQHAIGELSNANGTAYSVTIKDTAANIAAALNTLNSTAGLGGHIGKIVITDNAAVTVTAAQWSADQHAIGMLSNASGTAYSVTVRDTAANVTAALNTLNTALAGGSHIGSIVVSDLSTLTLSAAQAVHDAAALAKVVTGAGAAPTINVTDTAANLSASLDALSAVPHLGTITVSDGQPVTATCAQVANDLALHNQTFSIKVVDTAADIAANLDLLNGNSHVASIVVSDNQALNITAAQQTADAHAISELVNANGTAAVVKVPTAPVPSSSTTTMPVLNDFKGDGHTDILVENAYGVIDIGEMSGGKFVLTQASSLGSQWAIQADGHFTGTQSGYVISNASGVLDLATFNAKGVVSYTQVGTVAAGSSFHGATDIMGTGHDQFILESSTGVVSAGQISNGSVTYTQVATLASGVNIVGAGAYMGDGHDGYLTATAAGAISVTEMVGGHAVVTQVASLGSGWTVVGSGNFLGNGKTDFLVENASGVIQVGEVLNGHAVMSAVTTLGTGWKVVGMGDYGATGKDGLLIENGMGQLHDITMVNGVVQNTSFGSVSSAWHFH